MDNKRFGASVFVGFPGDVPKPQTSENMQGGRIPEPPGFGGDREPDPAFGAIFLEEPSEPIVVTEPTDVEEVPQQMENHIRHFLANATNDTILSNAYSRKEIEEFIAYTKEAISAQQLGGVDTSTAAVVVVRPTVETPELRQLKTVLAELEGALEHRDMLMQERAEDRENNAIMWHEVLGNLFSMDIDPKSGELQDKHSNTEKERILNDWLKNEMERGNRPVLKMDLLDGTESSDVDREAHSQQVENGDLFVEKIVGVGTFGAVFLVRANIIEKDGSSHPKQFIVKMSHPYDRNAVLANDDSDVTQKNAQFAAMAITEAQVVADLTQDPRQAQHFPQWYASATLKDLDDFLPRPSSPQFPNPDSSDIHITASVFEYVKGVDLRAVFGSSSRERYPSAVFQQAKLAESLRPKLEKNVDLLLDTSVQLTEAVYVMHKTGYLHYDLKLGNAILTEDGKVKLLDFGSSRGTDPASSDSVFMRGVEKLQEASTLATPQYTRDEYVHSAVTDKRRDITSLSLTLQKAIEKLHLTKTIADYRNNPQLFPNAYHPALDSLVQMDNILSAMNPEDLNDVPKLRTALQQMRAVQAEFSRLTAARKSAAQAPQQMTA